MDQRKEYWTILEDLKQNPILALSSPLTVTEDLKISRNGQILSSDTILKTDFVKKLDKSYPLAKHNIPNFRYSQTFPQIYGVGSCTEQEILKAILVIKEKHALTKTQKINWFFLRDEPMVYIDGVPHVLRDSTRPQHNLNNFFGISVERLTKIEEDLKEEVLQELDSYKGSILIHDEVKVGRVQFRWIQPAVIQTPKEFFESLNLNFIRLPLASGRSITEIVILIFWISLFNSSQHF